MGSDENYDETLKEHDQSRGSVGGARAYERNFHTLCHPENPIGRSLCL